MTRVTRFSILACLLLVVSAVAVGLVVLMTRNQSGNLKERHPLVSSYLSSVGKPQVEMLAEQIRKNYEIEGLISIADELKERDEEWAKIVFLIGDIDPKKYLLMIDEGLAGGRSSMGYLNHDAIARMPRLDLMKLEERVQGASFRERRRWLFAISYTLENYGELGKAKQAEVPE